MVGPLKRAVVSRRTLGLGVLFVVIALGSVVCASFQAWRYPCMSREPGVRGEVMKSPDGKVLYYNGTCWTTQRMPPTDMPL